MDAARSRIGGWDVHTHIVPQKVLEAAGEQAFGMSVTPDTLMICAHGVPVHPLSRAELLLARVASDGLDGAIVSVPPPLFRPDLPDGVTADYAHMVNDGLLEACRPHGDGLRPLAYLPVEKPELAADIALRLDGAWAGVVMGTEMHALSYASPRFRSLWRVLSDARLPLFIHPGTTPDQRLHPFYLSNLLGNPMETTIAAAHLIYGGVMHDFPDLKIILAHGGGCLAALCGRWQRGATTKRPGVPKLAMLPEDAVRRFYVDSLVHSPTYLEAIMDVVGVGRVLLGSDWPFPMGAPSAEHDLAHLDPTLKLRIRKTNFEEAFGARLFGDGSADMPRDHAAVQ